MFDLLKEKNRNFEIYSVESAQFAPFGRIIDIDANEIISAAKKISNPKNGSVYIASEPTFEDLSVAKVIKNEFFGELPTQIGYCYGHNNYLNATEWHTSSEINIAVTDLVLILGERKDIIDNRIDSAKFKSFFVPKGTAIEVYATSLHFCPCETDNNGFGCVVALPKDTNTPLDGAYSDKILFRKNKWLLSHIENKSLIERGAMPGIYGENYRINY